MSARSSTSRSDDYVPTPRHARRMAQEAVVVQQTKVAFGLAVLFRAPPPVHHDIGRVWIDRSPSRRVLVIASFTGPAGARALEMFAVRRREGLIGYGCDDATGNLLTAGPLLPEDEDVLWARGWKSTAAKALRAAVALR